MKHVVQIPDIRKRYEEIIRPEWIKSGKYVNIHAAPCLQKIVLNMGLGRQAQEKKVLEAAIDGLSAISGQMPCITKAQNSIAGFKLREGMVSGLKVTLRHNRMYEFVERLINIAMPCIRDFRGLSSKSFDGRGGFSFGIKDHSVFPEITHDERLTSALGMDISLATTAGSDESAKDLLQKLNFPFYN